MNIKSAVLRDERTFQSRITYRELTYRLATRLVEEGEDADAVVEQLKAEAKEVELDLELPNVVELRNKLGLTDYDISKVETYLIPTTLNTVVRGIAIKDGKEVRFYVERP